MEIELVINNEGSDDESEVYFNSNETPVPTGVFIATKAWERMGKPEKLQMVLTTV